MRAVMRFQGSDRARYRVGFDPTDHPGGTGSTSVRNGVGYFQH